jgi:hypothetical protein
MARFRQQLSGGNRRRAVGVLQGGPGLPPVPSYAPLTIFYDSAVQNKPVSPTVEVAGANDTATRGFAVRTQRIRNSVTVLSELENNKITIGGTVYDLGSESFPMRVASASSLHFSPKMPLIDVANAPSIFISYGYYSQGGASQHAPNTNFQSLPVTRLEVGNGEWTAWVGTPNTRENIAAAIAANPNFSLTQDAAHTASARYTFVQDGDDAGNCNGVTVAGIEPPQPSHSGDYGDSTDESSDYSPDYDGGA